MNPNDLTRAVLYPRPTPVKDITQYDENLFVWLDETGNVGGAAPEIGEAMRQMAGYAKAMDAPPGMSDKQLHLLLTIYEAPHPMHTLAAEVIRLRATMREYMRITELHHANRRQVWEAMTAMRNDLNEHYPMPSEESDLREGPEASVFCAAVVKAVVDGGNRRVLAAVRACYVRAGEAVEDYCSDMPDLAGHGHSVGLRDTIMALAPPELPRLEEKTRAPVTFPDEVYQHVRKSGRAQWGKTDEKTPLEHSRDMLESIRKTATHFKQETSMQPMHGVYVDGTGIVLAHTGTSPNSGETAGIIAGLWNMVHDSTPMLYDLVTPAPEQTEPGAEEPAGRIPDHE